MSKEMIISVNGREKKIAIVEDDVVTEFYVERGDENQGIVGNIYKGRVMKVLPGMQSAFVDIGLERDSFLYVSDFFDEEEEEEIEEKRETQRQVPKQPRAHREGLRIATPVEQEPEEDKDLELRMAALRHIEEISEEPAIEPPPEDEEAGVAEAADDAQTALSPRQRRQRRLRYADKEAKAEKAPAAAEIRPEIREVEAASEAASGAETEEDYSGRRRRRPRRRRGAEAAEAAPGATKGDDELPPYVIVHHEPLERIMDDDTAVVEGEMLKDAMLQERITERIHEEERRASLIEVEPTPEVLVGSLRRSIASELGFERVSDDSETRHYVEPNSELDIEAGKIEPISEWAPTVYETLVEAPDGARPDFEQSEQSELLEIDEDIRAIRSDATNNGDSIESPLEAAAEAPEEDGAEKTDTIDELKDAGAKIRQRPRRGEMATRRGGRGRRRGTPSTYRTTRAATATEPSVGVEERRDEEAYEPEEPAPAPAPLPRPALARSGDRFARPVITDLLREGQEIIVQIAKEPIGQKGARITSHVALPGRYIVYMPTVEHIGVSRKIGTDEERLRLKRILLGKRPGPSGGFITRTAAEGRTEDEIASDMLFLYNLWQDIKNKAEKKPAPLLLHHDLDIVQRILRDQLADSFKAIWIDSEDTYESMLRFVERFQPALVGKVKLYTREAPIFDAFNVTSELEKALRPKVWLKSGGYIVINQTEALVAIDVNTGKYVGKSNRLEDTIVKTNTEAIKEIVRQVRLRDLGGIIVIDFIDMDERKNRQKVMQALEEAMREDRAPYKILQFNDFGLVAITRKRVKQSLERTLCAPCPYCEGAGYVKSVQTVVGEILQEAHKLANVVDGKDVMLRVAPDVAKVLKSNQNTFLQELEEILGRTVMVKSDQQLHQEKFDLM